jgi:hypothetical protein
MKEQYIEDRFKRYLILGEYEDGDHVDLADRNGNVATNITISEASRIMVDRHLAIDMIIELALKLDEVAPDEFHKIWYGNER